MKQVMGPARHNLIGSNLRQTNEFSHRKLQVSTHVTPSQNLIGRQIVPQLASSEAFNKQKFSRQQTDNNISVDTRVHTNKLTSVQVITPLGDSAKKQSKQSSAAEQVRSNSEVKSPTKSPFQSKKEQTVGLISQFRAKDGFEDDETISQTEQPVKRIDADKSPVSSKMVKPSMRNLLEQTPAIFSTVSMQPEKKHMKGKVISGSANATQLIEASTLLRILALQKKYRREHYGWLDVSQIGVAGIPSLWTTSNKLIADKYIPPNVIKVLEKYHKMFVILRCHRRWEQEKLFGRNSNLHINNTQHQVDYELFTEKRLHSKYKKMTDMDICSVQASSAPVPLLTQYAKSFHSTSTYTNNQHAGNSPLPQRVAQHELDLAKYQLIQCTSRIVVQILDTNNAETIGETTTNLQGCSLFWSCNGLGTKPQIYQNLQEHQKVNHFLHSTELTRKDRLVCNYMKKRKVHGREEFNYLPETYEIPAQFDELHEAFQRNERRLEITDLERKITDATPVSKQHSPGSSDGELTPQSLEKSRPDHMYRDNVWIVKPACSSRGRGIFLVRDLKDVPMDDDERYVVSKYISNPLLLSGYKFDLRIYVLVTSIDPLRVYIYNEGLVRFASEPYHAQGSKFSHLTNYSINKNNASFVKNKNATEQDIGNKWSLSALQTHLKNLGIDLEIMWGKIYDAVLKSLISVESVIFEQAKKSQSNNSSCKSNFFELFGYDIILDSDLNPWILEVNLAPSLSADSPIDFHVKSNLIVDMFNLVGIRRLAGKRNLRKISKPKRQNSGIATTSGEPIMTRYGEPCFDNIASPTVGNKYTANNSMKNSVTQLRGPKVGMHTRGAGGWNGAVSQIRHPSQTNLPDYNSQKKQATHAYQNATSYPGFGGAAIAPPAFYEGIEVPVLEKISKVSAKHRAVLIEVLSEMERNTRLNFTRVYPAAGTQHYDRFFEAVRPNNRLVYRYLFEKTDLSVIVNQSCFDDLKPMKQWEEITDFSHPASTTDVSTMIKRVCDQEDTDAATEMMKSQATEKGGDDLAGRIIAKANQVKQSLRRPQNITMLEDEYDQMLKDTHHDKKRNDYTGTEIASPKPTTTRPETHQDELDTATVQSTEVVALTESKNQSTFAKQRSRDVAYSMSNEKPQTKVGLVSQDAKLPSLNIKQQVQQKPIDEQIKEANNQITSESLLPSSFNYMATPFASDQNKDRGEAPVANATFFPSANVTSMDKDKGVLTNMKESPAFRGHTELKEEKRDNGLPESAFQRYLQSDSPMTHHVSERTKNKTSESFSKQSAALSKAKSPTNEDEPIAERTEKKKKVIITGDDILIEYVRRLKNCMKKINTIIDSAMTYNMGRPSQSLPKSVLTSLDKFSQHRAWMVTGSDMQFNQASKVTHQSVFETATQLWQKLHVRYLQMKDQRDIVFKKSKKEKTEEAMRETRQLVKLRDEIVKSLTSEQLESMVMKSNLQGPIEIVSLLAGSESSGNLTICEKFLKRLSQVPDNTVSPSPMSFGNTRNSSHNMKSDTETENFSRSAMNNVRSYTQAEVDPYQNLPPQKMQQQNFYQLQKKFQTPTHMATKVAPEQELHAVNSAHAINSYWIKAQKTKIKSQKKNNESNNSTIQQTASAQRFFHEGATAAQHPAAQTMHAQGPATPQKKTYTKIQSMMGAEVSRPHNERIIDQRRATEKHISNNLTNIIAEVHDQIADKHISRQSQVAKTNLNKTQTGMIQKQNTEKISRQARVKHTMTQVKQNQINTSETLESAETARGTRVAGSKPVVKKLSVSAVRKVHLPVINQNK